MNEVMDVSGKIYDESDIVLQGILTEEMLKNSNIPLEQTKKHGKIKLSYATYNLYEVPSPYNKIVVYYGIYNYVMPTYYFTKNEIRQYGLEEVKENEFPTIECSWREGIDHKGNDINYTLTDYYYNRKNEPKYRIRFTVEPDFNPREWEWERSRKKSG